MCLFKTLTDEVYMVQSTWFIDKDHLAFICKLNKAIYGLKQAPHPWYNYLSNFLIKFGFANTTIYASLFIYYNGDGILYFFIYVED